jgi:hypothetical protein
MTGSENIWILNQQNPRINEGKITWKHHLLALAVYQIKPWFIVIVLKTHRIKYGTGTDIDFGSIIMSYGPLSIFNFHMNPQSAKDFWNGDLSAPVRIVQVIDQYSLNPDPEFRLSDADWEPGFFVIGNITVEKNAFPPAA